MLDEVAVRLNIASAGPRQAFLDQGVIDGHASPSTFQAGAGNVTRDIVRRMHLACPGASGESRKRPPFAGSRSAANAS
jgi:hypothetical protein